MSEFRDLAVEGSAIANLEPAKRYAEIIKPEPRYEEIQSLNNPDKTNKKLILTVKLSNGSQAEYYPNKTSGRFIANRIGTNMSDWIGKKIFWRVLKQLVAGDEKDVLYIDKVE